MALQSRDQRHQCLRYEGLQYTDADIVDFETSSRMLGAQGCSETECIHYPSLEDAI
ncbi:hypothetical protein Tco_0187321, partial [Tanacetum coccineum]